MNITARETSQQVFEKKKKKTKKKKNQHLFWNVKIYILVITCSFFHFEVRFFFQKTQTYCLDLSESFQISLGLLNTASIQPLRQGIASPPLHPHFFYVIVVDIVPLALRVQLIRGLLSAYPVLCTVAFLFLSAQF